MSCKVSCKKLVIIANSCFLYFQIKMFVWFELKIDVSLHYRSKTLGVY